MKKVEVIGTKEFGFRGNLKIECNENRLPFIGNIFSLNKENVLKLIDSMSIGEVIKVSSTDFKDDEVSCKNFKISFKKNYIASDVTFVANKFRINGGKMIDKIILSITGLENLIRETGDIIMNTCFYVDSYLVNAWINKLSCIDDNKNISINFIVKEKDKEVFKGEADIDTVFSLIDKILK